MSIDDDDFDEGDTMALRPGLGLKAMLDKIQRSRSPDFAEAHLAFRGIPAARRQLVGTRVSKTLAHLIENSRDPQHRADCEAFLKVVRALCE